MSLILKANVHGRKKIGVNTENRKKYKRHNPVGKREFIQTDNLKIRKIMLTG